MRTLSESYNLYSLEKSLAARDAEIARLREAVRRAYNEGFIEGTRENTSRGGNTWMESKARAALEASHDPTSK